MSRIQNMSNRFRARNTGILLTFFLSTVAYAQAPAKTLLKRILVLDKSQGGANDHLESRRDLNQSLAELAAGKSFQVNTIGQNDGQAIIRDQFSPALLSTYQAVIFSNNEGVDAQLDSVAKRNLESYVEFGGGLILIHSAGDFILNWPWLDTVLVEEFFGAHGSNQPAADLSHDSEGLAQGTETRGIFQGLTAPKSFIDEFYSFKASPRGRGVTILLTVDEATYTRPINAPMGADHPVAWSRRQGKGRVVYLSLGHSWSTNNAWSANDGYLKKFLYGSLRYVAGDFTGCTDPAYTEFNEDATHSDPSACQTRASVRITAGSSQDQLPVISQMQGAIRVDIYAQGPHEVLLRDLSGKVVDRRTGLDPIRYSVPVPDKAGFYLVSVRTGGRTENRLITAL